MANREPIPLNLKRKILVESGHRCSIPTCRFPTTEIAHIEPYSKVKNHEYHNLIALCPNCHTRFDNGEIDKKSMFLYKQKIAFLSDRYSKFELNVLDYLKNNKVVAIYGYLMVKNLFDEGLVEKIETICTHTSENSAQKLELEIIISLTEKGNTFLKEWENTENTLLTYFD